MGGVDRYKVLLLIVRINGMITAKEMREVFDGTINKRLDGFLNSVTMDAMLKQKSSPIDIDLTDIKKCVGSKRTDLADMAIKILEANGYTARIKIRVGAMYGITVVRVWW